MPDTIDRPYRKCSGCGRDLGLHERGRCGACRRAAASGTTNADRPFEPGELIEFSGDRFEILVNHGDRGTVREYPTGDFSITPFWWVFEGEVCRRVDGEKEGGPE